MRYARIINHIPTHREPVHGLIKANLHRKRRIIHATRPKTK